MSLDAFKESLVEELGNKVAFTVPVLGGVPVAESVVVTWIVMAALIALALAPVSYTHLTLPTNSRV